MCLCSAVSLALFPIFWANSSFVIKTWMFSAVAKISFVGTNIPFSLCFISEGIPPVSFAITGIPISCASHIVLGLFSMYDGWTNTSESIIASIKEVAFRTPFMFTLTELDLIFVNLSQSFIECTPYTFHSKSKLLYSFKICAVLKMISPPLYMAEDIILIIFFFFLFFCFSQIKFV